ncbi:MAG: primosomal protein N' (replication factor Y) [Alphaproteobacteria bacterium]
MVISQTKIEKTAPMAQIAQVIVPLPVFDFLDYKVPDDGQAYQVGDYVKISIGSRFETGIITAFKSESAFKKLKFITDKYPIPPLSPSMINFMQKVSHYTLSPIGDILKAVLRGCIINQKNLTTDYIIFNSMNYGKSTPKRQQIIEFLQDYPQGYEASMLRKSYSVPIIREMVKNNQLTLIQKEKNHAFQVPNIHHYQTQLGLEQQAALTEFKEHYCADNFVPFLLDGVTGSGKTELYLEAIAHIWAENPAEQPEQPEQPEQQGQKGQILILIPEIGLLEQSIKRFEKRFGVRPAIWHSQMTGQGRTLIRQGVIDGSIKCVIGARSGLFLPFKNLTMIIVDEEHDTSYKQEEGFRYHARDMSVMRAQIEKITIMLASATPSMESYVNAEMGRYHKLVLRHRFGNAILPNVHLVDLKQNAPPKGKWISPILQKAIMQAAFDGEQSLLFLNRRGYAPLMLCQGCGFRIECPFCSAWVVYHRQFEFLKCHQCGQTSNLPKQCNSCGATDKLTPCGPGVERLHEEVEVLFPHLKSVILSSDYQDNPEKLKDLLQQVYDGDIHILIGTQMIAKGHHFPHLTCVGIIDADLGLKGGDFRAFERSFQMLEQVSGRAGRMHKQGNVYVQTYNPSHPVMTALANHDRDSFLEYEANNRLEAEYPPFGRMAALILSCETEKKLIDYLRFMVKNIPDNDEITVFGPAPAPIFLLRGRYRYRFLIKTSRRILPQSYIRHWLSQFSMPNDIRLHIDIDPINFL